ncbi:OB-fold domain-containing protein [Nonomuraea sp. NPDC026600]|uniref:Zn-ribbon domain-containing OB-fold protein n=1 Tax=Nonomuraea sp. NPDC026600 TaxID=3155363 RepID=UPI0033CCE8A8
MPPEAAAQRPIPVPDEASAPFFEGAARGELMLQRCGSCGAFMWPVKPRCVECFSGEVRWEPASGRACLYSFVVVHQRYPGFEEPYVVATVETPEGVRFNTSVVGAAPGELKIGMPLEVVFEPVSADVVVPKFRRAA